MSHNLQFTRFNVIAVAQLTIVNYVSGGEVVSPNEFFGSPIDVVLMAPSTNNSLGAALFPILVNGRVRLFRFVGGSPTEIPSTPNLNCVISGVIGTFSPSGPEAT